MHNNVILRVSMALKTALKTQRHPWDSVTSRSGSVQQWVACSGERQPRLSRQLSRGSSGVARGRRLGGEKNAQRVGLVVIVVVATPPCGGGDREVPDARRTCARRATRHCVAKERAAAACNSG